MGDFRSDLAKLINTYSKENGSDTADWILAEYLFATLEVFDSAVRARERWYGRPTTDPPATPLPEKQAVK